MNCHLASGTTQGTEISKREGGNEMGELEVRIVELEPMRVASAHGFGQSPELEAWDKILAFARSKGLDLGKARFFGFNNPNPSHGSPNYGYDQWITVDPDVEAEGDIQIIDFPGGRYAVARCEGLSVIGEAWRQLALWFEDSPYKKLPHYGQCLEELLTSPDVLYEEYVFDLYLAIAE
jgi:DNA gyrase inhibitor GyrI